MTCTNGIEDAGSLNIDNCDRVYLGQFRSILSVCVRMCYVLLYVCGLHILYIHIKMYLNTHRERERERERERQTEYERMRQYMMQWHITIREAQSFLFAGICMQLRERPIIIG